MIRVTDLVGRSVLAPLILAPVVVVLALLGDFAPAARAEDAAFERLARDAMVATGNARAASPAALDAAAANLRTALQIGRAHV